MSLLFNVIRTIHFDRTCCYDNMLLKRNEQTSHEKIGCSCREFWILMAEIMV